MAALALGSFGPVPHTAEANLPPGAGCDPTPAPGTGLSWYEVEAMLPVEAGQNANGVCINCTWTGGANNSASLRNNAEGCVGVKVPTVGAGSSYIWADWGTNSCVAPGDIVRIRFKSGSSYMPVFDTATWNLADGTVIVGIGQSPLVLLSAA